MTLLLRLLDCEHIVFRAVHSTPYYAVTVVRAVATDIIDFSGTDDSVFSALWAITALFSMLKITSLRCVTQMQHVGTWSVVHTVSERQTLTSCVA